MIRSISNNFGSPEIEFKDYQDDNMVILNAVITIDTTTPAYKSASILEVKLPNLSIGRSAVSACFIQAEQLMWPGESYQQVYRFATITKTWLKDRNTLCIEKWPRYDAAGEVRVWIYSMYPIVGARDEVKVYDRTPVTYEMIQTPMAPAINCVVEEGWAFLSFNFGSMSFSRGTPIECRLAGFPEDIDTVIPVIGGGHQAEYGGALFHDATLKNGIFRIDSPVSSIQNSGYTPFVHAFIVR